MAYASSTAATTATGGSITGAVTQPQSNTTLYIVLAVVGLLLAGVLLWKGKGK